MKIALFGSSGFIGTPLFSFLQKKGHEVFPYSRDPTNRYYWDPKKRLLNLVDVDVVINLSGENIFGRWNKKKKKEIWESRVEASSFLIESLKKQKPSLKLYVGASAVGYYGDRGDVILTESSLPGYGFLANLDIELEKLGYQNTTRFVWLRLGVVLGKGGGALKNMLPLFKAGFGGKLGSGRQFMSWIDLDDLLAIIDFVIQNEKIRDGVNATSPYPVTNGEWTKTLGKILNRPTFFTLPSFLIKLVFGSTEMYLNSAKVVPEKLQESGFVFQYPRLEDSFKKIFAIK